jgi:hypothetical protein
MLILTGNDVGPNTNSLMVLGLVLLVLGALMNANIFGEMVSIFQQMNVGEMKVAEQLNNATTTMRNLKLPIRLQDEIRDFIIHTSSSLENQRELEIFLDSLTPTIKNKVTRHIFKASFHKDEIFNNNIEVINLLIIDLIPNIVQPDIIIIN